MKEKRPAAGSGAGGRQVAGARQVAVAAGGASIVRRAIIDAFAKLDLRVQWRSPVMFVVEVVAALTTYFAVRDWIVGLRAAGQVAGQAGFSLAIAGWLWATVLFANFAEAMAEGRGRARADAFRRTRTQTRAHKYRNAAATAETVDVPATDLRRGDRVLVKAGEVIPGDGEVVEGIASVDESAVTGESAPVIRESGGDRSAVTGGTVVLSDWLKIEITADPGETFLDRMIALVEGAKRQKTPNELALTILLIGLTIVFLVAVATLEPMAVYSGTVIGIPVLVALLVCLIPTTIGGLLSAIGIAGMDRLWRHNILATSGRAVEAAGDVDTLLLDKTGTITLGNRVAVELIPAPGVSEAELADAAQLASLADETPEGRSIVVLTKRSHNLRERDLGSLGARFVPFSAVTRMSGVDIGERRVRKGAVDAVERLLRESVGAKGQPGGASGRDGSALPAAVKQAADVVARSGGTPLVVADGQRAVGVIHLKDVVKGGIKQRFSDLRRMGIRTVMITGDNPLTAAAIAAEAGVDDFLAEATPEAKLRLVRQRQAEGYLVAMTGDGSNDAPALAQANVGLAMNSGTQAAKEAANMVDLDSNPSKLLEVVEIGKQLLITRGSLTTFSVANDVAKYFAIIPAIFGAAYPALKVLDIMRLATPQSAVLSAVIFNALIIVALVPLALRGVCYRAIGAAELLRRNLFIYGLGGLVAPFAGIKLIDVILAALHLV